MLTKPEKKNNFTFFGKVIKLKINTYIKTYIERKREREKKGEEEVRANDRDFIHLESFLSSRLLLFILAIYWQQSNEIEMRLLLLDY